jgi:predicted nucleotidyltransferase
MAADSITQTAATIQPFLSQVVLWAADCPDIQAVALVGSYAKGTAKPSSDIDLVLLVDKPSIYLVNTDWIGQFGTPDRQEVEDYGRLTSLRVWYMAGPEVEYGLTTPDWAIAPLDAGSQRVIVDGMIILYERYSLLSPWLEDATPK